MKVYRFTDEIMGSNTYLLPEPQIVIDTGTGYGSWEILKAMEEKAPLKGIGSIVLTHMHFDHSGGAESFVKATGARVFISEKDGEPLKKKGRKAAGYMSPISPIPDIDLEYIGQGDMIGPLRVIETPGHTAGSICLYEPEEKLLFTGDTVFADGVGRFDLPTGNREELKSSLRKLSDMNVRILYPGHGDTIGGEPDDVRAFLLELTGMV
jgi:glyoxylase-like metal-dependent hydrolase (beta-lactamase superfamily II)